MPGQEIYPPDNRERNIGSDSLLDFARKATQIPRETTGVISVIESQFSGQITRRVELQDGPVYISASSITGPDLAFHSPDAEIEYVRVLVQVWGLGDMSCSYHNGEIREISYIDASDPTKVWRDNDTEECRKEATGLLEFALSELKS